MNQLAKESKSWPYLSQLGVNFFGWSMCWTIAMSYMVPNALLVMVDDSVKNTRLGLMAGASNVLVLILIPLVGTLSDRLQSKFGRRRPFYLSASILAGVSVVLIVPIRYYPFLFALMLMMHVAQACWFPNHALIRDIVPLERRGRIASLTTLTGTAGMMLAHVLSPGFVSSGRMMTLALIAALTNIVCNLQVALGVKERPTTDSPVRSISFWKEVYVPDLKSVGSLGWLAAVNLLTQMGTVAMTCFILARSCSSRATASRPLLSRKARMRINGSFSSHSPSSSRVR